MPKLIARGVTLDEFNILVRQGSQWKQGHPSNAATATAAASGAEALSAHHWLALAALSLFCVLLSGVTFGWASLQLLLRDEGVFACDDGVSTCDAQDINFALVYTVAQFTHVAASLPVGFLLDHPRVGVDGTAALGGLLLACGFGLLANLGGRGAGSTSVLPAMIMVGAGGPCVFFPMLRRAEGFPGWESQVITLLNSLFDASAAVFAFVHWVVRSSGGDGDGGVSREGALGGLGVVAVLSVPANCLISLALGQGMFKPRRRSLPLSPLAFVEDDAAAVHRGNLGGGGGVEMTELRKTATAGAATGAAPVTIEAPLSELVWSRRFARLVAFGAVHVLRSNFYLGTVGDALRFQGDAGGRGVAVLGLILPLGVLLTPLVGKLIDVLGPWPSLVATNACGLLQAALALALPLALQPVAFAAYVAYRTMLYSCLVSAVATLFGFHVMGRLLGVLFTVAAVATLLQYPLAWWTVAAKGGDYAYAYALLALVQVPLFALLVPPAEGPMEPMGAGAVRAVDFGGAQHPAGLPRPTRAPQGPLPTADRPRHDPRAVERGGAVASTL